MGEVYAARDSGTVSIIDPLSLPQRVTVEDAQKITKPTLLVRGQLSPKYLHHIIDILASCLLNSEELIIPEESYNLGLLEKPVFNAGVLEFLSKYS